VVLEATGNALAIARILEPHVAEVVLAHSKDVRAISHARVKTDKIDARVLADLLAAGLIPTVWIGDDRCRMLRRLVSRRRGLVKRRTQVKNEISAVLHRNLKGPNPATDPFSGKGRSWMLEQQLPVDERLTLEAGLRQLDFLGGELAQVDRVIAEQVVGDPDVRRLLTIPGIDVVTASTLVAVIGDIRRFPTPAIWSAISDCTRASASPATRRRATAASARKALPPLATCSSKPPGRRPRAPVRCARSPNAPPAAAAATWPRSRSPASWRYSPGTCSPAARTTRSNAHLSCAASGARSSSPPALHAPSPGRTSTASGAPSLPTSPNGSSLSTPKSRTDDSSPTGRPARPSRVRTRHRSAHLKGPRRARPRGRPAAPDACTSPRQSPAPTPQDLTTASPTPPGV
jgi:transposase